ncbi:MAG: hypothetical protein U5L45_21985 [Saprospiraceae bacterium]|nr:hypothetical protein [Saprospiraceae bacterium]
MVTNLSFVVLLQDAPPSAAREVFFRASRFFVENLGKAQIFNKKTARAIRFFWVTSNKITLPHLLNLA